VLLVLLFVLAAWITVSIPVALIFARALRLDEGKRATPDLGDELGLGALEPERTEIAA
jgi:hypothetical protein